MKERQELENSPQLGELQVSLCIISKESILILTQQLFISNIYDVDDDDECRVKMYKPQHISQQEGGTKGLQEESCLRAAARVLPSLHSEAPCSQITTQLIIWRCNNILRKNSQYINVTES